MIILRKFTAPAGGGAAKRVRRGKASMNFFQRFMLGRYGLDQLSVAMVLLGMVLAIFSRVLGLWPLYTLAYLLLFLTILRVISRNIPRRTAENQKFLGLLYPLTRFWQGRGRRREDKKRYKYFRCKRCGQTLRVPRGRGKLQITCPKCHYEFIRKT